MQTYIAAIWVGCVCVVSLALLKAALRQKWLAICAFAPINIIGLVLPLMGEDVSVCLSYAVGVGSAWLLFGYIIARFGFLSFVIAWAVEFSCLFFPLTTDPTVWYFHFGLLAPAMIFCVAAVGWHIARRGKSVLLGGAA